MDHTSRTWLLVGSSPTAGDYFDDAFEIALWEDWHTATCNSGWQLFATSAEGFWRHRGPEWFWISDHEACAMPVHRRALRLMRSHGTKLVTSEQADPDVYRRRGLGQPDAVSPMRSRKVRHPFQAGQWCRPMFSGLMLLQWVLNTQMVDRVVLLGYDGYGSSDGQIVRETIDGRLGKENGQSDTHGIIGPFIQSCIDALPVVEFVICGQPRYDLRPAADADNLSIIGDPERIDRLKEVCA